MDAKFDIKFMALALNLAKRNLGLTAPNPVVGCVIVKDGEIISTGVTAVSGRPHAEKIAIDKVVDKQKLHGATLYVTLEPCCHTGQTAPCTNLIIESKFAKVVIATIDTYKKVNGNGIVKLREAGIDVVCGILEKEAREINKAFFKKQETHLPYVTLKLATSLDGKIATKNFNSKWITGEKARDFSHFLRAQNDAIMVGANTVKHDNPTLDCRIAGLEDHSPTRIIISDDFNFDENANIFSTAKKIKTIILASSINASSNKDKITKLQNLCVEIIFCDENSVAKNGKINLKIALEKIAESGVNSILIEGGQNLASQFLQQNLVDELVWIQNRKIIGNDGIAAIGELGFTALEEVIRNFTKTELQEISDEDFVSIYKR